MQSNTDKCLILSLYDSVYPGTWENHVTFAHNIHINCQTCTYKAHK